MDRSTSTQAESQAINPGSRLTFSGLPLVLASGSPRRRELLGALGALFRTIATDAEEQEHTPPAAIVAALPECPVPLVTHPTLLAWHKAGAACAEAPESVIIGADTIVVLDGDVLGKPRDPEHARSMLRRLSGQTHTVYTGLAVIQPGDRNLGPHTERVANPQLDLIASDVVVAELTDAEIADYVATGEPMDKAGAYGIQGLGGRLVRAVYGSYTCVVGLPIVTLQRMLAAAGFIGLNDPTITYLRWLEAQGKEPLPCPPTFP
jgi:septum formation protein